MQKSLVAAGGAGGQGAFAGSATLAGGAGGGSGMLGAGATVAIVDGWLAGAIATVSLRQAPLATPSKQSQTGRLIWARLGRAMGYDYYITRGQHGLDDAAPAITVDEWLRVAGSQADLRSVSHRRIGDTELKLPPDWHSHCWFAHPEYAGQPGPCFSLRDGHLSFRGNDEATHTFALRLADLLGARLFGEGGEEITAAGLVEGGGDSEFAAAVNPFTGERMIKEIVGQLARRDGELHLDAAKRYLLFPVGSLHVADELIGRILAVRGTYSEAGRFGADGSCQHVFYALRVLG